MHCKMYYYFRRFMRQMETVVEPAAHCVLPTMITLMIICRVES